jgi:hypothetical protein
MPFQGESWDNNNRMAALFLGGAFCVILDKMRPGSVCQIKFHSRDSFPRADFNKQSNDGSSSTIPSLSINTERSLRFISTCWLDDEKKVKNFF